MIIKNLWRRRTRSLLTLLGIAIGVAAVISLSAFGEGFASGFESIFSSSDADLTVGQKDAVMLLISSVDVEVGDEIKNIPGVDQVCGTVIGMVTMPDTPYFIVFGEDPHGFTMPHYKVISGTQISGRNQILLGKTTAENFKKKPGDVFRIETKTYRVAGIYETGGAIEDGGALLRLEDAQRGFKSRNQVNYYNVKVKDAWRTNEIKDEIEERWPKLAATRSGEATQQTEALDMYRSFGWFIGIFAVLIGGLGMMNTNLMSVFERTREIGVLRAIGWGKWRIIGMILGESMILSLAGGLIGILLGVGITQLAQLSPALSGMFSGVFKPMMFIQAIVLAMTLGVVSGVYPAWRAAQLTPIEAMRYESGASTNINPRLLKFFHFLSGSSLRNLWRRPMRTLITMMGIGIGVGFIVSLMAMTEGFVVMFEQMAGGGEVDLLAEEAKVADMSLSEIDERTVNRLVTIPEVSSVSRILMGFSSAPGLPYFIIFGLETNEEYIKHYRIREGRMFQKRKEIIVGRFAANGLKKGIGSTIRISGSSYTIVGIYENGSAFEDAGGAIDLSDAQDLFNKPRKVSLIGIRLIESARCNAAEIAKRIVGEFPDITVSKSSEFADNMNDMAVTYAILNALIILTLVIGGIVMTNAMMMSVFERTQEIGVLRALGWRKRQVISMILMESLALSGLSGVMGICIGLGLSYLFTLDPTMGSFLTPSYSPLVFIEVTLLTISLGTIGGIYPAWRATKLKPIEALRYE